MPNRNHPHAETAMRALDWLLGQAIPFWAAHGVDRSGFAHEEFAFDGQPKETGYRRTLVQFRQTYVFAHGALAGACPARVALDLFNRVSERAWHPHGGWVHRLDIYGAVLDETRDLYDQAFALLACAWAYALGGDQRCIDLARRTLQFLDQSLADPSGGYREALPERLPRRQNPHMHLLEALLALYEVTGDPDYLARANRLIDLLAAHFCDESSALREYFGSAWETLATEQGTLVEPGHHFEWVWLLHQHARLSSGAVHPLGETMMSFATSHGLNERGLAIEHVSARGHKLARSTKLWALTEQLKALVASAEARGAESDVRISEVTNGIFELLVTTNGAPLWCEAVSQHGELDQKRMPASTLYHLTLSFAELARWAGALPRVLTRVRA